MVLLALTEVFISYLMGSKVLKNSGALSFSGEKLRFIWQNTTFSTKAMTLRVEKN